MKHKYSLFALGLVLVLLAFYQRGWFTVGFWLGMNFIGLAIAHARGFHGIFGKRPDGTLPVCSKIAFFPLLLLTNVVWHLARLLAREPAFNMVSDELVIGRRLLDAEVVGEFDNYVDLTAEFSEPAAIRQKLCYCSFPILDGAAPDSDELRASVEKLRDGRTFIHCAQGHGRTGLFALAILLKSGRARYVEDGLEMLQRARPAIRLNREQLWCIQQLARELGKPLRV